MKPNRNANRFVLSKKLWNPKETRTVRCDTRWGNSIEISIRFPTTKSQINLNIFLFFFSYFAIVFIMYFFLPPSARRPFCAPLRRQLIRLWNFYRKVLSRATHEAGDPSYTHSHTHAVTESNCLNGCVSMCVRLRAKLLLSYTSWESFGKKK